MFASEITETDVSDLQHADIYLIGELHDNRVHHKRQAMAVDAIKPSALVLEMLSPDQAEKAQMADRSNPELLQDALKWNVAGWGDFASRAPVFQAAPDAKIYGAAQSAAAVRDAMSRGAVASFGEAAGQFGLATPLPAEEQATRETLQDQAHCGALPADMIPSMVEAQRFRDAAFARVALDALTETGGPVVVITGNGHARNWGMPHALKNAAPDVVVLSIGQITADEVPAPFDLWLVGPARSVEGDPCDAFKSK